MNYISSVHNDHVKHLVNLQNKSYRYEYRQFLAEGTRACTQLVTAYEPVAIYMTEDYYKNHTFQAYESYIIGVTDRVMEKICTTKNPSGICAVFYIPEEKPLPEEGPGIVLFQISDPGNLGTLIRTAAAMNITEIILVEGVDPYSQKVVQSTAGCMTKVHIYQTNFEKLKEKNLVICALVVQNGKKPQEIKLHKKFLAVGNEAHGLSPEQVQICQETMTIPMPGDAESLNAAVAGSIAMYLMATATL